MVFDSSSLYFPAAAQADIVRAAQKDKLCLSGLEGAVQDAVQSLLGPAAVMRHRDALHTLALALYYGTSTGCGQQTLGEEYCDILQVASSKLEPSAMQRASQVLLNTVLPFLNARMRRACDSLATADDDADDNEGDLYTDKDLAGRRSRALKSAAGRGAGAVDIARPPTRGKRRTARRRAVIAQSQHIDDGSDTEVSGICASASFAHISEGGESAWDQSETLSSSPESLGGPEAAQAPRAALRSPHQREPTAGANEVEPSAQAPAEQQRGGPASVSGRSMVTDSDISGARQPQPRLLDRIWLVWGRLVAAARANRRGLAVAALAALPLLSQAHLAFFYLRGVFFEVSKRLSGVRYVFVGASNAGRRHYGVVGALLLLQVAARTWWALMPSSTAGAGTSTPASVDALHVIGLDGRDAARAVGDEGAGARSESGSAGLANNEKTAVKHTLAAGPKCPLCLAPARTPTAAQCGHLFCWTCIVKWCKSKPECPVCRRPAIVQQLVPLAHSVVF